MTSHDLSQIVTKTYLVINELGILKSCVSGSAILARVLRRLGYSDAHVLAVSVQIHNPEMQKWMEIYDGPPTNEADRAEFDASDALLITIDKKSPVTDSQWAGHLTVILPRYECDRHLFMDLTIPQVNQPSLGVQLRPVIGLVRDSFVKGEDQFAANADGSLLIYDAFPDDYSYNDQGDCMTRLELDPAVENVIKRLG